MVLSNEKFEIARGTPFPLGATVDKKGINFSLFSEHAEGVELLLFATGAEVSVSPSLERPLQTIRLDPLQNRSFNFWHVYVVGAVAPLYYAYRVIGANNPAIGDRFDQSKMLVDPYALAVIPVQQSNEVPAVNWRGVVVDPHKYDWENVSAPGYLLKDMVIYQLHVKGFTKAKSSKVDSTSCASNSCAAGTFKGVVDKIAYLQSLGVTAVNLLPVFAFDYCNNVKITEDGRSFKNYWGEGSISFFAPHSGYCIDPAGGKQLDEFRDMVKALHRANIEVLLSVDFTHTYEREHDGPTVNFRGIDNRSYYHLMNGAPEFYTDPFAYGNALNMGHPIVKKMLIDALSFWVQEMHVDGFCFTQGSVIWRGADGLPLEHLDLLYQLESMPLFQHCKFIIDSWDSSGLKQRKNWGGYRWGECNQDYMEVIRKFLRGDCGGKMVGELASRIAGSSDLYAHTHHPAMNSVNYVTIFHGLTLMDLVSYTKKHNEINGENNRDGASQNFSWNSGEEGESDNPELLRFRKKRIKNFATVLFFSHGIPLVLSGDEVGKSQRGDNFVAYQDNEISWFEWNLVEKNWDLLRFFKGLIAFRRRSRSLSRDDFFTGVQNARGVCDIEWHGCRLHSPGWNDPHCKVLSFTLGAESNAADDFDIQLMINMDDKTLPFEISPRPQGRKWYRLIDTSIDAPYDYLEPDQVILISGERYLVNANSVVVLIAK
ncbi:MAG: glycogen debranching enzyme [Oligoflexia bacterium]|nr:glycogen debranching enzyme [Oligoflexia bacterium]